MAHDKHFWSLPREEALTQLMREFDLNREEAEAVLNRHSTPLIWRDAVELVTSKEMKRLLEEIARSGQNMSIGGKKEPFDEKQDDT